MRLAIVYYSLYSVSFGLMENKLACPFLFFKKKGMPFVFFKKKLEFYMLASVTVGGESSTEFWKNHGWLKNILTLRRT